MKNIWLLMIGCWFSLISSPAGYADEDYLLRVEMRGYEKSPEENPEEKLLHSIEVVTRLNQTFHGKSQSGRYAQTINGKLIRKEGKFAVNLEYLRTVDLGHGSDVFGNPQLGETGFKTSHHACQLDKASLIGWTETESQTNSCPLVRSKLRIYLQVTRYVPQEAFTTPDYNKPIIPEKEDIEQLQEQAQQEACPD